MPGTILRAYCEKPCNNSVRKAEVGHPAGVGMFLISTPFFTLGGGSIAQELSVSSRLSLLGGSHTVTSGGPISSSLCVSVLSSVKWDDRVFTTWNHLRIKCAHTFEAQCVDMVNSC